MNEERTTVVLRQRADYCFDNDFGPGGIATLASDEPAPLGGGQAIPIRTEVVDADGLRLTA